MTQYKVTIQFRDGPRNWSVEQMVRAKDALSAAATAAIRADLRGVHEGGEVDVTVEEVS